MNDPRADRRLEPKHKSFVEAFFDEATNTLSYIVMDLESKACAVIDSVLDFDYAACAVSYEGADKIIACIKEHDLSVEWIIETHVHADHLTAAPYIKQAVGGKIAIGEHIREVQETFGKIFNEGSEFLRDGSQFDVLIKDGDEYMIGNLSARALHTPGHTPACMTHVIGDAAFVGDTLFMPDGGTARADFPGGDARTLYKSIQKILSLPSDTRLMMCHDYAPADRGLAYESSIAEQRERNIHINVSIKEEDFIKTRNSRDKTLAVPRLILPALQVNMRAGTLPEPEANGTSYLKIPINAFG